MTTTAAPPKQSGRQGQVQIRKGRQSSQSSRDRRNADIDRRSPSGKRTYAN